MFQTPWRQIRICLIDDLLLEHAFFCVLYNIINVDRWSLFFLLGLNYSKIFFYFLWMVLTCAQNMPFPIHAKLFVFVCLIICLYHVLFFGNTKVENEKDKNLISFSYYTYKYFCLHLILNCASIIKIHLIWICL